MMDEDTYLRWLADPKGGSYVIVVPTGDGRWVGILPLMFHWTMHVGTMRDQAGHEDRFCYRTFQMTADALTEWASRDFQGDPEGGWHKAPYSGRIRPDGDATKEYIDRR
jgi:hypothetical protein